MDDLISRKALMGYTLNQKSKTIDCNDIARFPAADAEPVRHGRWIELSRLEVGGKCSVCGWRFEWFENAEAHYCPHCGAKMDLEG